MLRDGVGKLGGNQSMNALVCKNKEFGICPKCYWSH